MRLTERAHEIVSAVVSTGDVVIDATAGNGHDTCFLAQLVGSDGVVFAFDVQPTALARTAERLEQHGLSAARLCESDHAALQSVIPGELQGLIAAVMFNLGYLPGGDKSVITRRESTLAALNASLTVLRSGGVVTILAYPGHPGGDSETDAVTEFVAELNEKEFEMNTFQSDSTAPRTPRLFSILKR